MDCLSHKTKSRWISATHSLEWWMDQEKFDWWPFEWEFSRMRTMIEQSWVHAQLFCDHHWGNLKNYHRNIFRFPRHSETVPMDDCQGMMGRIIIKLSDKIEFVISPDLMNDTYSEPIPIKKFLKTSIEMRSCLLKFANSLTSCFKVDPALYRGVKKFV
jgi:hypothetical protein